MNIFHQYDKIFTKKIVALDKSFMSERYRTQKILYKFDNSLDKLLIQTPYIYNRYSYSSFEGNLENKLHLDLLLKVTASENIDENTKQINKLYKILIKIQKILKTRIRKKNLEKLNFSASIKEKKMDFDKENKYYNFRTKIHSLNGKPYLRIYNSNRQSEPSIKANSIVRFMLHLDSIWFFDDTYGINWYLVQAEIKLPEILQIYSFYNENEPIVEEKQPVIDTRYSKYLQMIKMRVPEGAVKNKMKMDGIDPNIYESLINRKKLLPSIPMPPPNFSLNVKLNKVVKKDEKKIEERINIKVPSQSQLLEQLKKLKKVTKD